MNREPDNLSTSEEGMDLRAELEKILHDVGPENIWWFVYDNENVFFVDGIVEMSDVCPQDILTVDF